MSIFTLIILALGLAMDAFAVSVSDGMSGKCGRLCNVFALSLTFGAFQAAMPIIGYFAGSLFSDAIAAFDHWIALALLGWLGANMLIDAIKDMRSPQEEDTSTGSLNLKLLLVQGVATSIDAAAVGVSFAVMDVNIWTAALAIGVITFAMCIVGCLIGRKFGNMLGHWAKVFGGVILIGIGIKIFIEHMFF